MKRRERVHRILATLELASQDLLDFCEEVWSRLDHNDPQELERACQFKQRYNERVQEFGELVAEIQGFISEYTEVEAQEGVAMT